MREKRQVILVTRKMEDQTLNTSHSHPHHQKNKTKETKQTKTIDRERGASEESTVL